MNAKTFESAYVNGEFSPLEAMKSLERENEMLRRDLEIVKRSRFRLSLMSDELKHENERLREAIEEVIEYCTC